jgi:DNA-binding transcriptional LysR family regulator
MRRRHQNINVAPEYLRTLVAISETRSFTKAGDRLGLSQPAITAQMKRLQLLVGGPIFNKTVGGVSLTPLGTLVLAHARRLLDANDQILRLGGIVQPCQPLRFGLLALYAEDFFAKWTGKATSQIHFCCHTSAELVKGLNEGYIDIALLLQPSIEAGAPILEWEEELIWARGPNFVLSPGAPVPLVTCPDSQMDLPLFRALEKAGMGYRIALTSSDLRARLSAVAAGVGLMGLPRRKIRPPLMAASESYLPSLQPLRFAVVVRPEHDREAAKPVLDVLQCIVPSKNIIPSKDVTQKLAS